MKPDQSNPDPVSLSDAVFHFTQLKLCKLSTLSHWEYYKLDQSQIHYAALDAAALMLLAKEIGHKETYDWTLLDG